MADRIQDRIDQYLKDTIAAERNFEKALATFGDAGEQTPVQSMLSAASAKAKTQHERLERLLAKRGGTPSEGKTVLAEMLAFTPLSAQIGQGAAEKNTQHLMVTFAAAAAEMAMYESLATAGSAGKADDVVSLARTLQEEEQDDYDQVWEVLRASASDSFQAELRNGKTANDLLKRYLEDAIAAEKSFETQLTGFSKEANNATVRQLFQQHAQETKEQHLQLSSRLEQLGGSTSTLKSVLAHVFNVAPKIAQLGHDEYERQTQNLMMAFAVENAEIAMYEALAEACRLAGDKETEALAVRIQEQERATADKVWEQIGPAARRAMEAARTDAVA
jgi:ferritin-like metal-binding protein YciE